MFQVHTVRSWFHADTILPMYEVALELSASKISPTVATLQTWTVNMTAVRKCTHITVNWCVFTIYLMNNAKFTRIRFQSTQPGLLPHNAKLSVVMPQYVICLSVTFRYHDNTGWNTSKIISQLHRLRYLLGLTPILAIWSNGKTSKISMEPRWVSENLQYLWNSAR